MCFNQPCLNGGVCLPEINGHICVCPTYFSGDICQIDGRPCSSSPCQNAGTCINDVTKYVCICPPGYDGVSCDIQINPCFPDPCPVNETCAAYPQDVHFQNGSQNSTYICNDNKKPGGNTNPTIPVIIGLGGSLFGIILVIFICKWRRKVRINEYAPTQNEMEMITPDTAVSTFVLKM
jgi:hypothetical protein